MRTLFWIVFYMVTIYLVGLFLIALFPFSLFIVVTLTFVFAIVSAVKGG